MLKILKTYGIPKTAAVITVITALLSLIFTCTVLLLTQGFIDAVGIFISITAPGILLPWPIIHFFKIMVKLDRAETDLKDKNRHLEDALAQVNELSGLLPICAGCKKIRDDKGYWNQLETYIEKHSNAQFSHGLCESCMEKMYGNEAWYIAKKNSS